MSNLHLMPGDGSTSTKAVTRMLELLKEEFPQYHNDRDQNIAAAMVLTAALGSVGAVVLIRDGSDRFDKFLRMIVNNVRDMSITGAKLVTEQPKPTRQ